MLTLLFVVLFFMVFGKLCWFGVKATWGIAKILFSLVFLPVVLIGLVIAGLVSVALPLLLVIAAVVAFVL